MNTTPRADEPAPTGDLPPLGPLPPRPAGLPDLSAPGPRPAGPTELPDLGPRPAPAGVPPLAPIVAPSTEEQTGKKPPAPPTRASHRRRRRGAGITLVAVVALGIAAGAGAVVTQLVSDDTPASTGNIPVKSTADDGKLSLPNAIAAVEPSVVEVQGSTSQGSGVVVSPRDLIVTNEHVISGETTLTVITADNRQIQAEVIATDTNSDLAILRPIGPPGPGVQMAPEPDGGLRQGDTVFAIGSPFGLRNTVTSGVVSNLGRLGDRGQSVIQTDTPINPGNSGGGLFDLRGRLVGIPTEIKSPVPGNVGIGFAVTTAPIKKLLDSVS